MLRLICSWGLLVMGAVLWANPDGAALKEAKFAEFLDTPSAHKPGTLTKDPKDIKPADVIHWSSPKVELEPDGKIRLSLRLQTDHGFTLYKDKVDFAFSLGLVLADRKDPPTQTKVDPITGADVDVYSGGDFEFVLLDPKQTRTVEVSIKYIGCTSRICLFPYTEVIRLSAGPTPPAESPASTRAAPDPLPTASSWDERLAEVLNHSSDLSLLMILLIAFCGGLLTNLTPCVYPMIPITVRILARQTHSPRLSAILYGLGLMTTYTGLGLIAASTGKLFGAVAASPEFNLGVSLCMFALGFGMLGLGNLSGLQRLGESLSQGAKGARASFLMGAGAGLIAAPCTGPILAALLTVTIASRSHWEAGAMFLLYSFGFALPYIVFGSFAGQLQKRLFSGGTQNLVKTLFSAVMFALGFYYLRICLYSLHQALAGQWGTISALGLGFGVLSLFVARRGVGPKISTGLGSIALGLSFFAATQWQTHANKSESTELHWLHSEDEALAKAQATGAPVLIDMWAEWCEACKKMEATTFADPGVREILKEKHWVLLKLDLTEESPNNDKIQERYHVQGLPTLVLIPGGKGIESQITLTGFISAERLKDELGTYSNKE